MRNAPSRSRAKDVTEEEPVPPWKNPREPVTADFGTFATLPSLLAEEQRLKDMSAGLGSEERLFNAVRQSVQVPAASSSQCTSSNVKTETTGEEDYWKGKAAEAEEYIRDVVYGGVDGFAYVRSLAEFLTPSEPIVSNMALALPNEFSPLIHPATWRRTSHIRRTGHARREMGGGERH